MRQPRVLALAGSLRTGSYNKMLVKAAARAAEAAGAGVTCLDLRDLPLPVFDEDLEAREGLHPNARRLKDLLLDCDALLISSPEYNSSISAALKNAIDWASRPCVGPDGKPEAPLACFRGRVVGLMSASTGALGGLRGLVTLRSILGNIGVIVLPEQLAVPKADQAFDESGTRLKDPKQQETLEALAARVVEVSRRLMKA